VGSRLPTTARTPTYAYLFFFPFIFHLDRRIESFRQARDDLNVESEDQRVRGGRSHQKQCMADCASVPLLYIFWRVENSTGCRIDTVMTLRKALLDGSLKKQITGGEGAVVKSLVRFFNRESATRLRRPAWEISFHFPPIPNLP
jgi:hypothetical protein